MGTSGRIELLEPRRMLSADVSTEAVQIGEMANLNGAIVFSAGRALMKLDETSGVASAIKYFYGAGTFDPGNKWFTSQAAPDHFLVIGSTLYFATDDGVHGHELWKSDGTSAGTVLVKDIQPGAGSASPSQMVAFNGKLYFNADDGVHGAELWTSDGTSAGTHMVKDIIAGATGANPYNLQVAGTNLFFQCGKSVYRSDGTSGGTTKVADLVGQDDATVYCVGDRAYLLEMQPDPQNPQSVYGQPQIRCIAPDGSITTVLDASVEGSNTGRAGGAGLGSQFYFDLGLELWVTDGTKAGTRKIKTFDYNGDSDLHIYGSTDDAVYVGTQGFLGPELWRTDGTDAGTVMVTTLPTLVGAGQVMPMGKTLYLDGMPEGMLVVGTGVSPHTIQIGGFFPALDSLIVDSHTFFVSGDNSSTPSHQGFIRKVHNEKLTTYQPVKPTATISAPDLVAAGQKTYAFTATFTSKFGVPLVGIDGHYYETGTIIDSSGVGNLQVGGVTPQSVFDSSSTFDGSGAINIGGGVTSGPPFSPLFHIDGPNGFSREAAFVAEDRTSDGAAGAGGSIRTVTWSVRAPGGTWDATDAGVYTISIYGGVSDVDNNVVPAGKVATFRVDPPSIPTATLTGTVFNDFDTDGTRDLSENGVGGYEVYIDSKRNGHYDIGEQTAVVDGDGKFIFTVPAGEYRLGLRDAKGLADTTGALVVSARPGTTAYANFGVAKSAAIAGTVFDDINSSATRTASKEAGIAGIVVWNDVNNDGVPETFEQVTRTDASGAYHLTVPWGTSRIRAFVPKGRRLTMLPPDTRALDVGGSATIDIGMTRKAYITGVYFNDKSGDGLLQSGETGIAGARIYLDLNDNGIFDSNEPATTSRSDGKYRLENILAGSYVLRAVPVGSGGVVTIGKDGYAVTLTAGATAKRNFGGS